MYIVEKNFINDFCLAASGRCGSGVGNRSIVFSIIFGIRSIN